MSAADATLRLLLLGEDRSASKALDNVGDSASKTRDRVSKLSSVAGKVLAVGLGAAVVAGVKFTKQAADDSEAAAKLSQALQRNAGATQSQVASVEEWITAQGKATGITDDELRPALQRLVSATGDVTKSQKLAMLAQDVAAGTGKSYGTVVEALVKAQNGSITGLSRLGVQTKDAEGKTKSLRDITKDLADTYGGQAATAADTAAGKQKILQTQMSELGESIGYELLPAMETMVDWLTKIVDWIGKNRTTAKVLVIALVATTAAVWGLNAAMSANPISLVVIAIAALVVGLVLAYKKSETFRKIVDAAFRAIGVAGKWMWNNAIKPAFEGLKAGIKAVGAIGKWLWNNVFQPVFKFIVSGIATLLSMWAKMLRAISHVPGFGWAKTAADALDKAADKAYALANNLNKLHDKTVTVTTRYVRTGNDSAGGPRDPGAAGKTGGLDGSDYGTVTLVLRSEDGREIQRKLLKLKRNNGGAQLGLA